MADAIRILVTLAEHADPRLVEQALQDDPSLEVAGYADYFDDWREFLEQQADVVIVACSAGEETATHMVDRAVKHRPDRPLIRPSSGVKVLIAPTRPDQASAISIDYLRDIYAALRTMCDAVIVDTPPGFTPEVIATIDVSGEVCMVGMLDSLSLKNTKLGLETLDLMGYDTESVSLVLNRADSRVGITPDAVPTTVA